MTREAIPLTLNDTAGFARSLRAALCAEAELPGHLGFLNHVARAAGFRNFQHLRAAVSGTPSAPTVDEKRLAQALRCFDIGGRMMRWPGKTSLQGLCLWAIWAQLPARQSLPEGDVNAVIDRWHGFGDRALVRRSLIDHGLATRGRDGRDYRRTEKAPPPEALALIRALARPAS